MKICNIPYLNGWNSSFYALHYLKNSKVNIKIKKNFKKELIVTQ